MYFDFGFSKKFIPMLGLLVVLCLSMSMVNATDVSNDSVDSSSIQFDSIPNSCSYNVSSEDDFKKVFDHLKSSEDVPSHVVINIVDDIKVKGSNIMSIGSKGITFDIMGNGHSIKVSSPNDRAENHFLTCGSDAKVFIKNLTLSGFNTAIINHGTLNLNNVTFDSNRLDYYFMEDYGGAIKSDGELTCDSCNFTNNYAKRGGAMYLDGVTHLNNCHFQGNDAYAWGTRGDDIDHDGELYIDGKGYDYLQNIKVGTHDNSPDYPYELIF